MLLHKINIKRLALATIALFALSCEDDDPITAGDGDPLAKSIQAVSVNLSVDDNRIGEENRLPVMVSLGESFSSDATITLRVDLDNGESSVGTATVVAGATSGTGSVVLPPDDGFIPTDLISEDAGTLKATAILLDELISGTTVIPESNTVDLDIWSDTNPGRGGLNVRLDWLGAPAVDIDMQIIDRAFTAIFESAGSGSRFESDLFQSAGRDDGFYDVYVIPFTAPAAEGTPYALFCTLPNGELVTVEGIIPADAVLGDRIPIAEFEKSTNVETGVVSYVNVQAL